MEALIGGIFNNVGFIARVAAFGKRCATNAVEEGLKLEPLVTKKITSLHNWSTLASASNNSDENSKVGHSRPK